MKMGRKDARRLAGANDDCASTITENNDGTAIFRITRAREHIGPDDQHMAGGTGFDELIGNGERIGEACAGRSHVKGRNTLYTEQSLQLAGSSREGIFSTGGGQHYHIEIGCGQTRCIQSTQGGLVRESDNVLVGTGNTALTDTGAFHDPLITGFNHLLEIGISTH